jgi:hypothetical protein
MSSNNDEQEPEGIKIYIKNYLFFLNIGFDKFKRKSQKKPN